MNRLARRVVNGLGIGTVIAAALGAGCAGSHDDPDGTTSAAAPGAVERAPGGAGTYVVMTRPPNVPSSFVATPNGWFDPDCVVEVAAEEQVAVDGRILRRDGSVSHEAHECSSPRFDVQGRVVSPSNRSEGRFHSDSKTTPTTNGYIEYLETTSIGAIGYVHAQWTVPSSPPSNTSQVVYFFPGLEDASNVDRILQPVLGWNQSSGPSGWSIASWNCCVSGTTTHSTYLAATPGTTVTGDMTGSNCTASTGICTNWQIVTTNPNGQGVSLSTTVSETMTFLIGAALEAYSIDTCSELPSNTSTTFSAFAFRNVSGTALAIPAWSQVVNTESPSCNYSVSTTSTTGTLSWNLQPQVCTPGSVQDCCPFPQGCSCDGTQECNSTGTGWFSCGGAGKAGSPCP